MKLLIMLLESFFSLKMAQQAAQLRETGRNAAEKGRRYAISFTFFFTGGAFIFSAILVTLIDLGLQIDRHNGVGFSGLMLSSCIMLFFAVLCILAGIVVSRSDSNPSPSRRRQEIEDFPESPLKSLLEEAAVHFLQEFLKKQKGKNTDSNPTTTP